VISVQRTRSSDKVSQGRAARVLTNHAYAVSSSMVAAITLGGLATSPFIYPANLDILYLLAVVIVALFASERAAIFTAIVSAVVFDFSFIPPRFSFHTSDLPYVISLVGFVLVALVISRLAAHARNALRERAAREAADARSEAKDDVLHKISHELRSPLTAVVGWAQFLRNVDSGREQTLTALDGLESSNEVLRRLVEDLWDASRGASGKLEVDLRPTVLQPLIEKTVSSLRFSAQQSGIDLVIRLEPVGEILGDPVRIEQIVTNLVSNAIKFTPRGGNIQIQLSRDRDETRLAVSDTGSGIPADFLPHVFEAFSQADPKHRRGGLGLGLAIVKHLVEAHHGTIGVTSDGPGRGCTFAVLFPAAVLRDQTLVRITGR